MAGIEVAMQHYVMAFHAVTPVSQPVVQHSVAEASHPVVQAEPATLN
jgi:hypothetical protein